MTKKIGVKKGNICHKCGEPPSDGRLTRFRKVWQCADCLLSPSQSRKIEAAYDDLARQGFGKCLLGDDSRMPSAEYYTIKEKEKITHGMKKYEIDSLGFRDPNIGIFQ